MTTRTLLLGLDIGSSFVKAALVDADTGALVSQGSAPASEMAISAPRSGWAEQDPDAWWHHAVAATREALGRPGLSGADVRAIGISYQMHGLVVVDREQRVLQAVHHLVRRPGGGHRRPRLRGDRPPLVPGAAAQLARQLHRVEAALGQGERAGGLRQDRQGDASRRLHRHEDDGPGRHHAVGPVRGDPVGF